MRDTALLIPDATPDFSSGIDPITVAVNGVTVMVMPTPTRNIPGKTEVQYDPGRFNPRSANPIATMDGPTISGNLFPKRGINAPAHRENPPIRIAKGRNAAPAAAAERS